MVKRVNQLIHNAIAPSTRSNYNRAWDLFQICMSNLNVPFCQIQSLPVSTEHLLLFIGYLHIEGYAPSTMLTYMSAISYVHKLKGLQDNTTEFVIQKALCGAMKLKPTSDPRLPITRCILQKMNLAFEQTVDNPYLRTMFKAMSVVSFFALMRVGEVTTDTNGEVSINLNQIQLYPEHVVITINKFKHNLTRKPFELVMVKQDIRDICPVHCLLEYLKLRGNTPGPLFCMPDLKPITRDIFIKNLKIALSFCGLDPTLYKSHSYRIGGASYYAEIGLSDEQIRLIGRWKTNAFRKYIRSQRILLALKN